MAKLTMLPVEWMPLVPMQRLILHWTGGGYTANRDDLAAYHLLIQHPPRLVRGFASIAYNSGSLQVGYAAHTLNANSGAIGLALCGMREAVEKPFHAGPSPITLAQWDFALLVAAQLCAFYNIPAERPQLLSHAEVQPTLGIRQNAKWDIVRLPWDPQIIGPIAVGDRFRREVRALLDHETPEPPKPPEPQRATLAVIAESLNARRSPNGEIVGTLPLGTRVTALGREGNWRHVATPAGHRVWLHASFLVVVDGPPVEFNLHPDPQRQLVAQIRDLLDAFEGAL